MVSRCLLTFSGRGDSCWCTEPSGDAVSLTSDLTAVPAVGCRVHPRTAGAESQIPG